MRKFHPMKFGQSATGSVKVIPGGQTYEHACTACGKRHPHSGHPDALVVTKWCDQCSPVSIYKANSKILLRANTPRQMISVVV